MVLLNRTKVHKYYKKLHMLTKYKKAILLQGGGRKSEENFAYKGGPYDYEKIYQ